MDQFSIIKQIFESLSKEEKESFLEYLKGNSPKSDNAPLSFSSIVIQQNPSSLPDRPSCPHCKSNHIVKNGHKKDTQRYFCKDCKKSFVITNNTLLYYSKKSLSTWEKYFECLLNKFSLRKSAKICNIDVSTAFIWRHKVLDVLQNMQNTVSMDGVVEADEAYFHVSYKGDHKKSNFKLPRKVHKRGKAVPTRGLSKEQVCVPCSVNLDGLSFGKVSNLGEPSVKDLSSVFDGRIEKGSIFVTDSLRVYHKIAYDNELTHIRIPRGKHTNGAFNIQTINAYHSELKRLVYGNFKGVATKYLNNYIVYHNFVNFSKGEFTEKFNILRKFIYSTEAHIKSKEISHRERIPVLRKTA